MTTETLKRTPLYEEHVALNARMVPFGGWEMPVQYEGILAEYEQTRQRASLFDISHMGEFIVEGDAVATGLDRLVTMTIVDMPIQSCRYGTLLNEQGGVIDDLIVFRLEKEKWFIVVNGSTTEKDAQHFRQHLKNPSAFRDVSLDIGKLDLQGPLSRDVLTTLVPDISKLEYYRFNFFNLLGENVLISRTGYTGELGYEIYYPWKKTKDLWNKILKNDKVKPAGLGARDVLRLEMGYSLYGHELNEQRTPLESGLTRFVNFDKDFIGQQALLKQKTQGIGKTIIGIKSLTRRAPREGHAVYNEEGQVIGQITSGTFSPYQSAGIGLALIDASQNTKDKKIYFGDDKNKIEARITTKIFYPNGSIKS